MLARWHDPEGSGRTFYLPPGHHPALPSSEAAGKGRPASGPGLGLPPEAAGILERSDTGGVLLWSLAESRLVLPPFPVERAGEHAGFNTAPLQSLLDRPRRVLVLLLRMGGFAIGMFEGERLVASKVDAPFVKGRHRQGGSSSGRFARRREGQERMLFDKACETLRAVVEGEKPGASPGAAAPPAPPQHLVLGGDRLTLQAFEERCAYLSRFRDVRLGRILVDIPDPRLAVLRDAPRLFYASRVVTFVP